MDENKKAVPTASHAITSCRRSIMDNDLERETEIRRLGAAIEASANRDEKRQLFARMASLIASRSPSTVTAMEAARGLSASAGITVGGGNNGR
jgi:hypothetical protein